MKLKRLHLTISKLVIIKELLNILVRIQLVTLCQSLSNFLHHIYEGVIRQKCYELRSLGLDNRTTLVYE